MDLSKLQYLPLGLSHFSLLTVLYVIVVVWIEVRAFRLASMRMGFGPTVALIWLLASLAGSYLNIPVARLPPGQVVSGEVISFFGMDYVVPTVTNWPGTVIAVNVGGAVIPGLLSPSSRRCAIHWRRRFPASVSLFRCLCRHCRRLRWR